MNKREYFIKALKAKAYCYKDWVISAFSVSGASNNTKHYPYELVRSAAGVFYRNPDDLTELLKIDDSSDEALFRFHDPITLVPEEALNLTETVKTTYGNVFFNYYVLIHAFGAKLAFMPGRTSPKDVEKIIEPILTNIPPEGAVRDPKLIYIDEYKRFSKSMFALMGFAQLCVPSATPRTMTTDPRIPELRAKLLNKYKDTLHESATIVKIEQELIAMDKEWMRGDPDGGDGFYIYPNKSYDVVRKKLFLMHGIETAFKDGTDIDLITNNLSEGWDIEKLPSMVNSLREGSYNRGRDTALGGEAVKFLGRVFQNTTIVEEDCGSTLGWSKSVTEDNYKSYVGFFKISPKGSEELTEDSLKASIGKSLVIRTPMMCKTPRTGFCVACMGRRNAINPTALGLLAADVGSQMMGIFMSMMHGRSMKVAKYSFKDSIT